MLLHACGSGAPPSVILIDIHPLYREGVRRLIEKQTTYAVVGEAEKAHDAVRLAGELRPAVAVTALGASGVSLTRQLLGRHASLKILFLTDVAPLDMVRIGAAGAMGFALKTSPPARTLDAIHAVLLGEKYVDPDLPLVPFPELAAGSGVDPLTSLTPRELDVFHLVAAGNATRDIAAIYLISTKTVEMHRTNINRKLSLHSPADVTNFALFHGLRPTSS